MSSAVIFCKRIASHRAPAKGCEARFCGEKEE